MFSEEKKSKCVIVLLGAPGSGKGTQAKNIAEEKKLPHISTGELFRYNMNHQTALGEKARHFINQGKLVPDALVLKMLYERLSFEDCQDGCLLDGVPRTIHQADSIEHFFPKDTKFFVINLEVTQDMILKRILGRLSCGRCGNIQNRYFTPPRLEGVCDECGAKFIVREDDNADVVRERLKSYSELTAPLAEYYKNKGVLHSFNGELDSDTVFLQIKAELDRCCINHH